MRHTRRAMRVASLMLVVTGTVIGLTGAPAGAAELSDSGWWWKVNAGDAVEGPGPAPNVGLPETSPTPPPPPAVPEGGLYVARDADGAHAMGAVRFALGEDEENAVLTLTVASGGDTAAEGDLLACQTGSAWTGKHGGRWDSKPLVQCDTNLGGGSVAGVAAEDGSAWTFGLSALVAEDDGSRVIDVAIVPALDAEAPAGAQRPFQLAFEKVDTASLAVEKGGGDAFPAPDSFGDPGNDVSASPAGSAGSDFSAPPAVEPSIGQPAIEPQDQGLSPTAPVRRTGTPSPAAVAVQSASGDTDARTAALGVLMAGAVVLYFAGRQRTPLPRTLTRMNRRPAASTVTPTQPQVGGLGRFARPRSAPPQAL